MDAHEVAEMLHCTYSHVATLARKHEIPAKKVGRYWRFVYGDVLSWMHEPLQGVESDGDS